MSFHYDATGIDPDMTYPLLPDGWYPFEIVETEETESKNGHRMILAKCRPANTDMVIFHFVTFIPNGLPGAGINVHFRKCIGVAWEGDVLVNAEEWISKEFMGQVITRLYNGKKRNSIVDVAALNKETIGMYKPSLEEKSSFSPEKEEIPF